ncbi:hypothetical protein BCR34DRAFT_608225 [Clohesyomyces aquaticus]|uniref:SUR7/PalI family-domain-containing protein n=1 Tax=Clohesyomyces aquaticus TaxID=1231657 RepID=A0A1Y1YAH4_9PLEO|nr:hypothetical protein BCR34DRAFT_608225 [Clohesyomyces aquaticus]
MLHAGSGAIKDGLPSDPGRYIILIETDQVTREINGETFHGLPDSHDFSRNKDFFGIFPSLYCSGMKKDGKYLVDYCSPWGKQFFDLHRLWRVWGVDLIKDNLIGQAPKQIFICFSIGAETTALALIAGVLGLRLYWGALAATLCGWIAAIIILGSAAFSTIFINRPVGKASDRRLNGTDTLAIYPGRGYLYTIWIAAVLALVGAIAWSVLIWYKRGARKRSPADDKKATGYVGIIRRTTGELFGKVSTRGNTSYKHLSGGHEFTELHSRDGSQIDLIPRAHSGREEEEGDLAFEPLRHRQFAD